MSSQDAYPLPRATGEKAAETERLDGQHEMFRLALGGIATAPLPADVSSVLDLGCGTGIWSCQFAASHPSAQILGVDIAPPTGPAHGDRLVPKNCTFAQADIESDWDFAASRSFDFVFARLLITAIRDWPRLFSRVYASLRPEGIFEHCEGVMIFRADDGSTAADSPMIRWYDALRDFVASRGADPDSTARFNSLLQDCGFEMIHDRTFRLYLDPDVAVSHGIANGAEVAKQTMTDFRNMIILMTDKVFTSAAERSLAAEALEDLARNSGHRGYYACCTLKVVRKPAAAV